MTEPGCAHVAGQLSAWIDGELDDLSAAGIGDHVVGCLSCQRRHALLTAASRAVRSLPAEAVSASFDDAFRRRLAATRTVGGNVREQRKTIAGAGLAAVLVLAVLGILALRRASMPREAPPARSTEMPWCLAACAAPTAGEYTLDNPCASAEACGLVALYGEPSGHAPASAVRAGAPCASAATCGVVVLVSWKASDGHSPLARRTTSARRP